MTRPNSIANLTLYPFLDATRQRHNDLGSRDFIERRKLGVPVKRIAEDFGVSKVTVHTWIRHEVQE